MPERIVVSFRGVVAADEGGLARYLARALSMKKNAEALGATLCAWSAQTFAFEFAPDELEEAVTLGLEARQGAPLGERFGVGIAQGEMNVVGEAGSLAVLSWGPPLVDAVALSREARSGEALLAPRLGTLRCDELEALGHAPVADGTRRVWVLGASPEPAPGADEPPTERRPTIPPPVRPSVPDELAEGAKRALVTGDVAVLERLLVELRETGEYAELVERMAGFVALQRGATAEALRKLRAAADADQVPAQRARSRLAYGVALAAAGRAEAATLEVLEALARAREAEDQQGEHACARFLARLSSASGHSKAATIWARIAASTAPARLSGA